MSLDTSSKELGIIHCSEYKTTIPYTENREANLEIVKLIFLQGESIEFEELSQWLNSQETSDSLSRNESAGTQRVQLKVEDVRKENSSS